MGDTDEAFREALERSLKSAEEDKARRDKDASAMRESVQAARTSHSLKQSMKAVGAVESGKVGRALLLQKFLPYTKVKGDALCGMTTVALQTNGPLVPTKALDEINC